MEENMKFYPRLSEELISADGEMSGCILWSFQ